MVLRLITRLYNSIGKRARVITPLIVCAVLFCYFLMHYSSGEHGLEARDRFSARVNSLQSELKDLQKQRSYLEKRISLMTASQLNPDLADELARKNLEYADQNDLILFE